MCREQLPGWQRFYQRNRDKNFEILSVAMDAQGQKVARPYVEQAGTTFPTLVDEENLLGELYGFKAIPNGLLIDETGTLHYFKFVGFDVKKPEVEELVQRWVDSPRQLTPEPGKRPTDMIKDPAKTAAAFTHFRQGLAYYRKGRAQEAVAKWREAVALDPDNYVMRKQIWAVEHPERFYTGPVDYAWQREQMQQGR